MIRRPRFLQAQPCFRVPDLDSALCFYRDRLGFRLDHRSGDTHAVLERDGVRHHLSTVEGAVPGSAQFVVEAVDDLLEALVKTDVEVVHPIGDRPWGMRDFTVADPFGNRVTFSEPVRRDP